MAFLNRVVQSVAVGWGAIGDWRALYLSFLYPVRDFLGFLTWAGSSASRTFSGAERAIGSARAEESFLRIGRQRARWERSCSLD